VPLADFTAIDGLWVALSIFCILVAAGLLYALVRVGATVGRLSSFIQGLEQELLPVINRLGGTVDRVNQQLDKVDQVTDSAVDAAESVDSAVRAVTSALTRPVQRISGLASGIAHGTASLRTRHDVRGAVETGRQAAARREQEIAEEIARAGEEPPAVPPSSAPPG
jgi:uncharacterized protein YoxC